MPMTMVERAGEALARQLNRRQTVKRAAVALFGMVAAWTVEGFRGNGALAQECGYVTGDCVCAPPEGLYCTAMDPSFCAGSACSGGCYYDESYRYAGACWCSATCDFNGGESGYYHCCDCNCYGTLCACREFIPTGYSAAPAPPGPGDGPPALPPMLPPRPGDDEPPSRPPGVPECFPFCD
jgi:hypothetical protein